MSVGGTIMQGDCAGLMGASIIDPGYCTIAADRIANTRTAKEASDGEA